MTKPRFTHKDYVLIAETIASIAPLDDGTRRAIADAFAIGLRGTNPAFDRERFIACATGKPVTGRDKSRG